MKVLFHTLIILLLAAAVHAQEVNLPKLAVECPEVANVGEPIEFRLTADPAWSPRALSVISYSWTASEGKIRSGQGTDAIKLVAESAGTVTATVQLGNVRFEPVEERCSTEIYAKPEPRLISDFRAYNIEYVEMMLETLLNDLRNDPAATGHLVLHGKNPRSVARLERMIRDRLRVVGFDPGRITIVRGKDKPDPRLEFWLVPAGADHPK